jgi:hypothetical protein
MLHFSYRRASPGVHNNSRPARLQIARYIIVEARA